MTLSDIQNNHSGTISGFDLPDMKQLSRLYAMGLIPGACLQVIRRAPLGDPIQVKVGGSLLSIRKCDAQGILVACENQAKAS